MENPRKESLSLPFYRRNKQRKGDLRRDKVYRTFGPSGHKRRAHWAFRFSISLCFCFIRLSRSEHELTSEFEPEAFLSFLLLAKKRAKQENISLIELLLTYLQDIVKLPLLLLLSKLLYLNPLSSGKPSLVLMTDLARAAGRELTMDVREMPRDGIERLTTIEWNSRGWRALRLKLYGEKRFPLELRKPLLVADDGADRSTSSPIKSLLSLPSRLCYRRLWGSRNRRALILGCPSFLSLSLGESIPMEFRMNELFQCLPDWFLLQDPSVKGLESMNLLECGIRTIRDPKEQKKRQVNPSPKKKERYQSEVVLGAMASSKVTDPRPSDDQPKKRSKSAERVALETGVGELKLNVADGEAILTQLLMAEPPLSSFAAF
ncbi:hypothetical protein V6N11_014201 [Hibiscus sabdariffa]|uniref:Uncharacterized protein n=1 Tax=Hibiscus sabdariffa TaxID=183260 RepID=A0ABR2AFW5_9ROSI